jgi:hypothetical protein
MKDQITPTALFQITTSGQTHVLKVHIAPTKKEHEDDFISPAQRYHHLFCAQSLRNFMPLSRHNGCNNVLVLCYICAFLGLNANGGPLQRNCGCCDFPGLGQITLRYRLYQAFIVVSLSSG